MNVNDCTAVRKIAGRRKILPSGIGVQESVAVLQDELQALNSYASEGTSNMDGDISL